jgi:polyisoprenyl-phosphate glycosyltransferase
MNSPFTLPGSIEPPATAQLLSVVVPAYNEEGNVRLVYEGIRASCQGVTGVEIIFVDDGSSDRTAECVRELRSTDPAVRLVRFGRNFGQQAALLAGLQAACGAAVVTLDCDLQQPPELLPRMLDAWRGGAKVVQMVRLQSDGAGWFKRSSSKVFYRLLNLLSETPLVSGAADYQLLDRVVVESVLQFKDRQPFLRGLVPWLGFASTRMEYVARARRAGDTRYTTRKMVRLAVQAITGLSSKPLRFSFYLGLLTALLSLLYGVFALVAMIAGQTVAGWTSVIVMLTFLGAVQLISIGVLGEYIARIYEQTRGVPPFVIVEIDEPAAPTNESPPSTNSIAARRIP